MGKEFRHFLPRKKFWEIQGWINNKMLAKCNEMKGGLPTWEKLVFPLEKIQRDA